MLTKLCSRFLCCLLFSSLVLGCASRKPKPTVAEPGKPPTPMEKKQKPIALVLGGVGVSSFATVGLLKGFKEEGIEISFIVSTGWPSLFALGYGFFKSIHDLEWFAMRLNAKDFYSERFLGKKGFASHDAFSKRVSRAYKQGRLNESSVPIVLTASNLREPSPDTYDSGGWKAPLLKAISAPGIFQPFPRRSSRQWVLSLNGVDVGVAKKREAPIVVAVSMYEDYLNFLDKAPDSSEGVFRRIFATNFRHRLQDQLGLAQASERIHLRKGPLDFSAKRQAIHSGYKTAKRIVRELRSQLMEEE